MKNERSQFRMKNKIVNSTKEQLDLDIKKLKEEDRRFLLNRNLNEIIASLQGSMYNTSTTSSLLALFLSGFSIVSLTKDLNLIFTYTTFSLILILFFIRKYKKFQFNLRRERDDLKLDYSKLFKYHLDYAIKK